VRLRTLLPVFVLAVGLTACSAVRFQSASPEQLPVGFAIRTLTYSLPDGSPRTITIDIWYPAHQAPATPTDTATQGSAGVAPNSDSPRPLVVFSHGNGARPTGYSRILSYFASQGYVVAAPEHQDCPSSCSQAQYSAEITRRPLDVQSTLDYILSVNSSQDDALRDLIDASRVAVAGQSFGGWSAVQALRADTRFRAALLMNAAMEQQTPADPTHIAMPVLMMTGELDALVPFAATEDFFARMPSTSDRWLLVVPNAGHEFSNGCFSTAATLPCASLLPQDRLINIIQSVGTQFLSEYVGGSSNALAETTTPEYTLMRAPAGQPPQELPTAAALNALTAAPIATPSPAQALQLPTASLDPARYSAGYLDSGVYDIAIRRSFAQGEVVVPGTYVDATLSVDVQLLQPRDDQYVQLACREANPTTEYRMGFRPSTGEVWINRWNGHPQAALPYATLVDSSTSPLPDGSSFRISLGCVGTHLSGAINGTTVVSASDNSLPSGQFWIGVGETPGGSHPDVLAEAHFTNLTVTTGS
jgi:dienelactone hydrolase